ncbi:MAG: universal stress protein, partial [Bacteroidia bacterium]|nr:universal stress protein [Bacteroidia bacterium]
MKKILVPTDFSPCASLSAETALQIAKKFGASVDFLHSADTASDWSSLLDINDKHHPEEQKLLDYALDELHLLEKMAERENVNAKSHLAHDFSADDIIQFGKKLECDMMVMNTHCSSGIKEYITGTIEQKVIRLSKLLVLALKTPPENVEFNNILFASDFEPESHGAVDSVLGFAQKFKSKLSFLYVDTPQAGDHAVNRKKSMGQLKKKYDSIVSDMHIESAN